MESMNTRYSDLTSSVPMKDQSKNSVLNDDSPTSVSDDVYSPTVKEEVKCNIIFHSPTKNSVADDTHGAKGRCLSSISRNILYSTGLLHSSTTKSDTGKTYPSGPHSPLPKRQLMDRSPRRRASTGDNHISKWSQHGIPLKDATLLALATRGTGYACEESSPGGIVVDEHSRMLILKGEYFTPKKDKRRKSALTMRDLNASGISFGTNSLEGVAETDGHYSISEDDKYLLELSQRPSFQSPDSVLKKLLHHSMDNGSLSKMQRSVTSSSDTVHCGDLLTPSRRRSLSVSDSSTNGGDVTHDMTLHLVDAHQSPLRRAFLELADISSPLVRNTPQPPPQLLAAQQLQRPRQGAGLGDKLTENVDSVVMTTTPPSLTSNSDGLENIHQWATKTHNFSKDGWKENMSYNSSFACHRLMSEDTFMEWEQIRDVILQGALSEDVIRKEFHRSAKATACALGRNSANPTEIRSGDGNTSSDYLYPKKTSSIANQPFTTSTTTVAAVDMMEFSCLMARLELLYEEGSEYREPQREAIDDSRYNDVINGSESSSIGDSFDYGGDDDNDGVTAVSEDVYEMYGLLVGASEVTAGQGLTFVDLMRWDKMQEAIASNFVSEKTVHHLFRQVVNQREEKPQLKLSTSAGAYPHHEELSLDLHEFDRFCALLQHSIDSPCDNDDQSGEEHTLSENTAIATTTASNTHHTTEDAPATTCVPAERGSVCRTSPVGAFATEPYKKDTSLESCADTSPYSAKACAEGSEVSGHESVGASSRPRDPLSNRLESSSPALSSTSSTTSYMSSPIGGSALNAYEMPSESVYVGSTLSSAEAPLVERVPVITDMDTSVIGCNDISMISCEERTLLHYGDGSGRASDEYSFNEVSFLQTNTFLDSTGVLRMGRGVSMAGDLYRKDARALSSLCPDVSILSSAACEATWRKTFFALRGHMLTYFDISKRKIVASDVRECKARCTTTPKVLRKSEPAGFKFVIISKGKCMYLVAGSEEERQLWVEKINENMNKIKGSFLVL